MGRLWLRSLLLALTCAMLFCLAGAAFAQADDNIRPVSLRLLPFLPENSLLLPRSPCRGDGMESGVDEGGGYRGIARSERRFPRATAGVTMDIPNLAEGVYELKVTLTVDGKPVLMTRSFTRKKFPGSRGRMAYGPEVLPPFTPLTYDMQKKVLHCVLRDYAMGNSGFWDQATSEGHPLLTAPMRLEVARGRPTLYGERARASLQHPAAEPGTGAMRHGARGR